MAINPLALAQEFSPLERTVLENVKNPTTTYLSYNENSDTWVCKDLKEAPLQKLSFLQKTFQTKTAAPAVVSTTYHNITIVYDKDSEHHFIDLMPTLSKIEHQRAILLPETSLAADSGFEEIRDFEAEAIRLNDSFMDLHARLSTSTPLQLVTLKEEFFGLKRELNNLTKTINDPDAIILCKSSELGAKQNIQRIIDNSEGVAQVLDKKFARLAMSGVLPALSEQGHAIRVPAAQARHQATMPFVLNELKTTQQARLTRREAEQDGLTEETVNLALERLLEDEFQNGIAGHLSELSAAHSFAETLVRGIIKEPFEQKEAFLEKAGNLIQASKTLKLELTSFLNELQGMQRRPQHTSSEDLFDDYEDILSTPALAREDLVNIRRISGTLNLLIQQFNDLSITVDQLLSHPPQLPLSEEQEGLLTLLRSSLGKQNEIKKLLEEDFGYLFRHSIFNQLKERNDNRREVLSNNTEVLNLCVKPAKGNLVFSYNAETKTLSAKPKGLLDRAQKITLSDGNTLYCNHNDLGNIVKLLTFAELISRSGEVAKRETISLRQELSEEKNQFRVALLKLL